MLVEAIQSLFISKKQTLSLAESCTGGAVSAKLVTVPDCSLYFLGGVIAYCNFAKSHLLGVSSFLIAEKGAVSEEVALEMARGARHQFNTDYSAAITGITGPSGGSEHKPIGTVCFAISGKGERVWTCHFEGKRQKIIEQSVQEILEKLLKTISFQ